MGPVLALIRSGALEGVDGLAGQAKPPAHLALRCVVPWSDAAAEGNAKGIR